MDALFSHPDRQYPNNNAPRSKPTRKPFRKNAAPPPKSTVNDVYDHGPENPLIYAMTHRLDASLIGRIYQICREQDKGFDDIITEALTTYTDKNLRTR